MDDIKTAQTWGPWSALIVLAGCIAVAVWAFKNVAVQDGEKARQLRMYTNAKPALEVIEVDMSDARIMGAAPSPYRRGSYPKSTWTALEAGDWFLLNGNQSLSSCYFVLEPFARANGMLLYYWPLENISVGISAWKGKTKKVSVRIPRFNGRPDGLEQCIGYSYDAKTKMLLVGSRKVAFIDEYQPDWADVPSEM